MNRRWYQDSDIIDFVKIYATRLSRLHFLQHACSGDHPVLVAEKQLIEIAHSKLQEVLLKSFSVREILEMRPYVVWWIRSIAKARVCSHISNEAAREVIVSAIEGNALDTLFEFDGH